jgi:hypothetical protein
LGFRVEYVIKNQIGLAYGVGQGIWGSKDGLRVNYYYNKSPLGGYILAGISNNSSSKGEKKYFNLEVERTNGFETTKSEESVAMEKKRVRTIDLGWGYAKKVGRNGKFFIELGYAIRLHDTKKSYTLTYVENAKHPGTTAQINEDIERILSLYVPGGYMVGIGLMFGL